MVYRIPEKRDVDVLQNAGMIIKSGDKERRIQQSSATADFLYGLKEKDPLELNPGTSVTVEPFVDNPGQIATVSLFFDFEKIEMLSIPPFIFTLRIDQPGKHTVNVEFKSKSGIFTSVHGDINITRN
jgi:hypothetical protein